MAGEGVIPHETVVLERRQSEKDGTGKTFSYENSLGDVATFKVFDPHRQKVRRSPKGRKGFTRYGAKMVRSGCYLLQSVYGKRRLGFGTLTLDSAPKVDGVAMPELLGLLCMAWSEIVRKTIQEIKRELERRGAPSEVVAVTEDQSKRTKKVGFIVPHLHFVYVSWDGKSKGEDKKPQWYIPHAKMKEIFDRVCANELFKQLSNPELDIEVSNRVNLQAVRKSAEGYLGKYMTKGAKDIKKYLEQDPNRQDIPSHWWHCTKGLRDAVKSLIKPVLPSLIEGILGNFSELIREKVIQYCRPIEIEFNGVKRTIGYGFRLYPEYIAVGKSDMIAAFNSTA